MKAEFSLGICFNNGDPLNHGRILVAPYEEYRGHVSYVSIENAIDRININSTKSMTGHLLGAAGAIEAIASILAMKHGIVPPTINHNVVDDNIDSSLNLTLNKAQKRVVNVAMSNTFGFGGHNACVLFKKLED